MHVGEGMRRYDGALAPLSDQKLGRRERRQSRKCQHQKESSERHEPRFEASSVY